MADDSGSHLVLMLVASDRVVTSVLYRFYPEKELKPIFSGKTRAWNGKNKESFTTAASTTIDSCLNQLGKEKRNVSQLIFMISPFWTINSEKIVEAKAELLKDVCRRYNLKPGGFVVDDEAIIDYYRTKDGSLPSFISVFFAGGEFRLSLVHLGKIKGRLKLKLDEDINPQKVKEGLAKIDFDGVLPPQIIAWGEMPPDFEDQMNDYGWIEDGSGVFLHLPEIKVFNWERMARVFSQIILHQLEKMDFTSASEAKLKAKAKEEAVAPEEKEEEASKESVDQPKSDFPFGFSFRDIALSTKRLEAQEASQPEEKVIKTKKEALSSVGREKPNLGLVGLRSVMAKTGVRKRAGLVLISGRMKALLAKLRLLSRRERKPVEGHPSARRLDFSFLQGKARLIGIGVGSGVLLLAAVFSSVKAKVEVFVTPEVVEEEISVYLSEEGELDLNKGVIPVRRLSARAEKSFSAVATGTKLIGEKATGKVTVYNRTDETATFAKGDALLGPGGLEFIFENEVKVASKTPDLASGVDRWGESEAGVAAADIGSRYNLAKGTVFTIKGSSGDLYLVKNKNDFSGGTSREIGAVSQQDLDKAKEKLTEQLRAVVEKDLQDKVEGSDRLIKETVVFKTISFETDQEAGAESSSFKAVLEMEASGLVFSDEKVNQLAQRLLGSKVPAGFTLRQGAVEFDFTPIESTKGKWEGRLVIKAKALPELDLDRLRADIKGKIKDKAGEKIKAYPRVYRYLLTVEPSWLRFWPLISWREKNINIVLKEK